MREIYLLAALTLAEQFATEAHNLLSRGMGKISCHSPPGQFEPPERRGPPPPLPQRGIVEVTWSKLTGFK
jgi:hypothetical protein